MVSNHVFFFGKYIGLKNCIFMSVILSGRKRENSRVATPVSVTNLRIAPNGEDIYFTLASDNLHVPLFGTDHFSSTSIRSYFCVAEVFCAAVNSLK